MKSEALLEFTDNVFNGTRIKITTEGKRHLTASLGSDTFREKYAIDKVKNWCDEIERLSEFAKCQPLAAYIAFIHGELHKYTYFMRTINTPNKYVS